jgi:hypothetical protein
VAGPVDDEASVAALAEDTTPEETVQPVRRFEGKVEGGYYGGILINLNYLVYNSGFGASFLGGYRVNDYFVISAGAGLERLEDGVLVPFFVNLESYYTKKKKGYVEARIGYSTGFNNRSINIEYNYGGGVLFSVGIGRDLYTNERIRLGFNFSYNYRQAHYTYTPFEDSESLTSNFDYHLFSGKIAFSFR